MGGTLRAQAAGAGDSWESKIAYGRAELSCSMKYSATLKALTFFMNILSSGRQRVHVERRSLRRVVGQFGISIRPPDPSIMLQIEESFPSVVS